MNRPMKWFKSSELIVQINVKIKLINECINEIKKKKIWINWGERWNITLGKRSL